MRNRGQLTIFIFIGVLVVSFILFLMILMSDYLLKEVNSAGEEINFENREIAGFYSNSRDCLRDVAQKIVNQIGTNKEEVIQEYLKVYGEKCFNESGLNLEIEIEPPFSIDITEVEGKVFVEINIDTKVSVLNQTSSMNSFSFEINKKAESEEFEEVTFVDSDEEVSFIYQNFSSSDSLQGEIIVEYSFIPEDVIEFEKVMMNLPILEREFLMNISQIEEMILDEKFFEIVLNHSYDERIVYNASNISFEEISEILLNFDFVRAVSRNSEFRLFDVDSSSAILNDVFYGKQWYLHNEGQFFGRKGADINIDEAWDVTLGDSEVVIAVIDQGVFSNRDYKENILFSDCYNFVDNSFNINPRSRYEYHGSHVTGIISSEQNNDYGIAGICPGCSIINMRIANSKGEIKSKDVIDAVMRAAAEGADIISLSLGGGDYSSYEESIFSKLSNKGVVIVAAAGNEASRSKVYPAAYRGVISVGATNNLDQKAYFSNYGSWIDLYAPGEMIASACGVNQFCFDSGTSMATPIVSGIIGLMLSKDPDLKPTKILSILKNSGERVDYDKIRVDAGKAVSGLVSSEKEEFNLVNESLEIEHIIEEIKINRSEILKKRDEALKIIEIEEVFDDEEFSNVLEFCENNSISCDLYCSSNVRDEVLCNFISL